MSDINRLREAFSEMMAEGYEECFRGKFETAKQALEALDRIEARLIPELPEGWKLGNLYEERNNYVCVLLSSPCDYRAGVRGEGATIREAVYTAIKACGQTLPPVFDNSKIKYYVDFGHK